MEANKVKNKLTGLLIGIPGRKPDGNETKLQISNEVDDIVHFNLGGNEIFIEKRLLLTAIAVLNGDKSIKH